MWSVVAWFCPPVAVFATGNFLQALANMGLTLLLYIPGVIHARGIVDQHENMKRNEALLKALEAYPL